MVDWFIDHIKAEQGIEVARMSRMLARLPCLAGHGRGVPLHVAVSESRFLLVVLTMFLCSFTPTKRTDVRWLTRTAQREILLAR